MVEVKYYCDVCKKKIAFKVYKVMLDNNFLHDLCKECYVDIEKFLKVERDNSDGTSVGPEIFVAMTPCDDCPCLSDDREDGGECKMGFDSGLYWTIDGQLITASKNCELVEIVSKHKTIRKPYYVVAREARTDGKD